MRAIWSRCAISICDPCVSHLASILQEHTYIICEPCDLDRCAIAICDPCVCHLASMLQGHMYTICKPYRLDLQSPSVIHVLAIWHQYCKTIICTVYTIGLCKPYSRYVEQMFNIRRHAYVVSSYLYSHPDL